MSKTHRRGIPIPLVRPNSVSDQAETTFAVGSAPYEQPAVPEPFQRVLHDIQTPVAVLELSLALLAGDLGSATPEALSTLHDARRAARRIRQYIDHFVASEIFGELALRRGRFRVELRALLARLVAEYQSYADGCGISLELRLPQDPVECARADEIMLERVFQNLLEISLRHLGESRRIRLEAQGGSVAEVRFCHDGAMSLADGPWPCQQPSDPLRLKACQRAIVAHGGTIALEHDADWSTCLVVRLPTASL